MIYSTVNFSSKKEEAYSSLMRRAQWITLQAFVQSRQVQEAG